MADNYYKTKESVNEYIRLAEGVNGGELIGKLNTFLPKDSKVLELGSGPGTDWKLLQKDYSVVGSDNSGQFLEHLEESNPMGKFLKLDAVSLDTNECYDGIYSNKVLHHLSDEELKESINNQLSRLNENGIVCHSFWNGKGSEYFKGLFVNYHSKDDLMGYFAASFEVLYLDFYQEFYKEDSLLFVGRRK